MKLRRNVPDCEFPWLIAHEIRPPSTLATPLASRSPYRRYDVRSRVAANPSPWTLGSLAVYTSSYRYAGSNPPFTQIFRGSGVPGNGVVVQSANAQASLRTGTIELVSERRRVNVAFDVSRLAGSAVPATPPRRMGRVVAPAGMSVNRASTGPVM